ncbi:Uncharacterised protein [Mycobacteroides abscessus subsp. abscessus]|nr:Uncharacterised protein [Mycobacteroides abscessus subsp. abscessus]
MAAVSGRAAAAVMLTPLGTGSTWVAATFTRSAYPPPAISAHTASPGTQPCTAGPTSAIWPETSRPGISLTPGGGG